MRSQVVANLIEANTGNIRDAGAEHYPTPENINKAIEMHKQWWPKGPHNDPEDIAGTLLDYVPGHDNVTGDQVRRVMENTGMIKPGEKSQSWEEPLR